ncbi:MAG: hypothetical protein N3F09_05420 [Bacteroidia bacterium]|nr:hypothetical protein [Bacteroidia bacterium]
MKFTNHMRVFLVGLSVMLFCSQCTKKDTSNVVPVIEYKYFNPLDIQNAQIFINFEDGDGDLFFFSDSKDPNFFLEFEYKDSVGNFKPALWPIAISRENKPDTIIFQKKIIQYTVYHPKNLASDQYIKGTVMITLTGWRPSVLYKKFRYKIYAIDRKGNKSEIIYTPEINVNI